jgi:hypothetical protein
MGPEVSDSDPHDSILPKHAPDILERPPKDFGAVPRTETTARSRNVRIWGDRGAPSSSAPVQRNVGRPVICMVDVAFLQQHVGTPHTPCPPALPLSILPSPRPPPPRRRPAAPSSRAAVAAGG